MVSFPFFKYCPSLLKAVVLCLLITGFALPLHTFAEEVPELGLCPQSRENTPKAPEEWARKTNPLERSPYNIRKGRTLYMSEDRGLRCLHCHGVHGDGRGDHAADTFPAPRNFTCEETMKTVSDGQMYWAITHGLPHTTMPAFDNLSETQIWQLVWFVREFPHF